MPSVIQSPQPGQESLRGVPYEKTTAAEPPVLFAKSPQAPLNKTLNRLKSPRSVHQLPSKPRSKFHDDVRRDSGLTPSSSSTQDSRTTLPTELESSSSLRQSTSLPSFRAQEEPRPSSPKNETARRMNEVTGSSAVPLRSFKGILTEIPTGSFEDLTNPGQMEFSKRGSMLLGGKKAITKREDLMNGKTVGSRRKQIVSTLASSVTLPARALSADEEVLSNKVRSMYEEGGRADTQQANGLINVMENGQAKEEDSRQYQPSIRIIDIKGVTSNGAPTSDPTERDNTFTDQHIRALLRESKELAGGIEDWEDVNSGDVDRYGFIVPRKISSQASSMYSAQVQPDLPRIQRMSTLLQLASEAPRRKRSRLGKPRSTKSPARSTDTRSVSNSPPGLLRPHSSQSSYRSTSGQHSKFRSAANKLPHNKDRRCVDEAGDMLTLPPGLADIAEDEENGIKRVDRYKMQEWERDEKWRKMAKVVKKDAQGGGMVFEFDTSSHKVIERTWKGVPDKWRATAWHSFLSTSARKRKDNLSDEELKAIFRKLLEKASPDDVQIDLDVPRTISSHIMFRRRYRGGQRLLFRVLHAMSIYFPDTGYVQGMAALAATLLCYYDEEMAFVMLVRLWQLRGLEQLYRSGFAGLMAALEEFEREWMGGGEVAAKLVRGFLSPSLYTLTFSIMLIDMCRTNSTSPPPPTAPAGTSPSSITPSPSPLSFAYGTCSCFSVTQRSLVLPHHQRRLASPLLHHLPPPSTPPNHLLYLFTIVWMCSTPSPPH